MSRTTCSRGTPDRAGDARRAPAAGGEAREVGGCAERLGDDLPDLAEVVLVEAAHRRRGCADAHTGRDRRRALVERHRVAVDGQLDLVEALLRVLARPLRPPQVELEEVRVRAAREHVQAGRRSARPRARRRSRAPASGTRGTPPSRRCGSTRLRGDHVLERAALHAGEDGAVDRLRVLLAAEDEAGPRPGERLVRGRGDDVAVLDRVRMEPGGDETGEVGHVAHEQRADLVGDLAELGRSRRCADRRSRRRRSASAGAPSRGRAPRRSRRRSSRGETP